MSTSKRILIKVSQAFFEYLLLLPLFMLIGIYLFNDKQLVYWLIGMFVLFAIGIIFRTLVYHQKWWVFSLFSIIMSVSYGLMFGRELLLLIILTMIHMFIVYRGMMYASQKWEKLLPIPMLWLGGLSIYFISHFIFKFVGELQPYLNKVTMFGIVFVILTLFVSNSDHLKNTTLSKKRTPFISRTIKNQNRMFLIITIAIIALITNGKRIQEILWNGFRKTVNWLIELLSNGEGGEIIGEDTPPVSMDPVLPFEESNEPSALTKLMETMIMYIVYIFVAVVIIMLFLLMIKKTRKWFINILRSIIHFLKSIVNHVIEPDESTQYIEEKESIFDWNEWKEEKQAKAKEVIENMFKRKPKWDSLSNQEKVRIVFREFVEQEMNRGKLKDHATPREILEVLKKTRETDLETIEQLRIAYEQARYGEKDIEQQIVDEIYLLIDRSK